MKTLVSGDLVAMTARPEDPTGDPGRDPWRERPVSLDPRWIGVPRDGMDMGICRIEIGRIAMDEEIGGERFATERASNQVRRQPLDSKGARAEVDVQQPPGGSVEAPPVHHSYITHPWPMACSKRLRFVRTGGGPPSGAPVR